jgi:hypothetical protein
MKSRTNVRNQLGCNLVAALPSLAVGTVMALGGAAHPVAIPYGTERRVAAWVGKLEFHAEGELNPLPVGDSRPLPPESSATYKATWRTVPTEAILERLKASGVLWFVGGPTTPGSSRKRVYLDPKIGDRRPAELICRWAIERAGGDPADLVVALPNAERVRLGVEAIRQLKREEATSGPVRDSASGPRPRPGLGTVMA